MPDTLMSAGGGLSKSKLALANAALSDVLSGKTFYAGDKILHTGTLALTGNAAAGDVLNGVTFYSTNPKSKQTGTLSLSGNAGTGDVLNGKTFYNTNAKSKQTGTMPNHGSISATLGVGGKKSYSAGYYSGGTVSVAALPSTTANASDIKSGKIALNSNGVQIKGTHTEPTLHRLLLGTYSNSDSSISINVASQVPVYRSLTADNFFIELYGCTAQAGALTQASANGSATQTKSYNASNGVFTASSCTAPATAPNISAYGKPQRKVYVVWVA